MIIIIINLFNVDVAVLQLQSFKNATLYVKKANRCQLKNRF